MTAAAVQAFDDVLGMVKEAYADTPEVILVYPGKDYDALFSGVKPWIKISLSHQNREAATISGAGGIRRYVATGFMSMQIMVPRTHDDSLTYSQELGKLFTDAFEGKLSPNGIEFFSVTASEAQPIDRWNMVNCTLRFRYNETK